jgi:hypothetical protein
MAVWPLVPYLTNEVVCDVEVDLVSPVRGRHQMLSHFVVESVLLPEVGEVVVDGVDLDVDILQVIVDLGPMLGSIFTAISEQLIGGN